jgi:hypothetical protein
MQTSQNLELQVSRNPVLTYKAEGVQGRHSTWPPVFTYAGMHMWIHTHASVCVCVCVCVCKAEKVAQCLRALAVLPKAPGLIPSTRIG